MKRTLAKLTPLNIKNKLAPTPNKAPRLSIDITNLAGKKEALGDPRATRALVALMNQHAVVGGAACHWGGPAAFAEIMSSIHTIMFRESIWHEKYNFINDAGHAENGIYALRANYGFDGLNFEALRGFRGINSKLTGHGESHLNPEGVFISNGPLGSGPPQGQGLALADKIIGNDRVTICAISDGASMEGEAKEAFSAIPGMAKRGQLNPFVLLISDNNTKLSGRISDDSFDMSPSLLSLETLGWKVINVENGHDLNAVHAANEKAILDASANPLRPVVVIFKTIKGFGIKATETSASGGHGYPLKAYDPKLPEFIQELYDGSAPEEFIKWAEEIIASKPTSASSEKDESKVKKEKVQPGFARAINAAASAGSPVFSVCADLQGSTGIAGFHKEFPERYIDVGIAESNMISTAIGLSKQGLIPIVDTFAQFGVTKGNLPLIMASLTQGPIIALFSHIGFQDAADGASHQATTFLSAVAGIPELDAVVCSCSLEAEKYMETAIKNFESTIASGKTPRSTIFFMGRENHPHYYKEGLSYEWGKAQVLFEGSDVTIVANGPMVAKALASITLLKENGIKPTIINSPFANNPDIKTISSAIAKTKGKLITIEDHQIIGGMGSILSHALLQAGHSFKLKSLGIPATFGQSAYQADHLYDRYGLNADGILKTIRSL